MPFSEILTPCPVDKIHPMRFSSIHVSASALLRPWSIPAKLLEFKPHEVHHATHKMLPWKPLKPPLVFQSPTSPLGPTQKILWWPPCPFGLRGQDWPLAGTKCPFLRISFFHNLTAPSPRSQSYHSPDHLSSRSKDFLSGQNTSIEWYDESYLSDPKYLSGTVLSICYIHWFSSSSIQPVKMSSLYWFAIPRTFECLLIRKIVKTNIHKNIVYISIIVYTTNITVV